jgi:hypothetical protein
MIKTRFKTAIITQGKQNILFFAMINDIYKMSLSIKGKSKITTLNEGYY